MLDRQVGDASPRIYAVRAEKGVSGTRVQTTAGRPAMLPVIRRLAGSEVEAGEDRAKEQPAAVVTADEIGMLPFPADARRLGERLFHRRRSVHEHFELGRGV